MIKPFTILHADDDRGILCVMKRWFEREAPHYRLISAENGRKALEHIVEADALLTDIRMPDIRGEELAERAREQNPEIFVVYNTGSGGENERKLLQQQSNTAYTLKGYTTPKQIAQFMHFVHNELPQNHPTTLSIGTISNYENHDNLVAEDEFTAARILNNKHVNVFLEDNIPTDTFSDTYPYLNRESKETVEHPNIYIITGPKGAGKDSLARNTSLALPHTEVVWRVHTRLPRPLELSGHPLRFVTREEIEQNKEAYAAITPRGEDRQHLAAIPWESIDDALRKGKDALVVAAEPSTVTTLQHTLAPRYENNIHTIHVTAPYNERVARTRLRGGSPTTNDSPEFANINADIAIANPGAESCKPFLPSKKLLANLHASTQQLVQYIQNT